MNSSSPSPPSRIQLGVVCFHKRIRSIYSSRWIRKCLQSIFEQTFQAFDLIELNYHDTLEPYLKEEFATLVPSTWQGNWITLHQECPDHSVAMNVCFDYVKERPSSTGHSYLAIANVNLDDFYRQNRFELQFARIQAGIDLVSSYFSHIIETYDPRGDPKDEVIFRVEPMITSLNELRTKIRQINHLAHPVMMVSTRVWRENPDFCYRQEIPAEDWKLWQRMLDSPTVTCEIIPEHLLFYRIHGHQISRRKV